jgi:hypothetical protein
VSFFFLYCGGGFFSALSWRPPLAFVPCRILEGTLFSFIYHQWLDGIALDDELTFFLAAAGHLFRRYRCHYFGWTAILSSVIAGFVLVVQSNGFVLLLFVLLGWNLSA